MPWFLLPWLVFGFVVGFLLSQYLNHERRITTLEKDLRETARIHEVPGLKDSIVEEKWYTKQEKS